MSDHAQSGDNDDAEDHRRAKIRETSSCDGFGYNYFKTQKLNSNPEPIKRIDFEHLANEIFVTIKLNFDKGYIIGNDLRAQKGLKLLIDKWDKELHPEEPGYVPD